MQSRASESSTGVTVHGQDQTEVRSSLSCAHIGVQVHEAELRLRVPHPLHAVQLGAVSAGELELVHLVVVAAVVLRLQPVEGVLHSASKEGSRPPGTHYAVRT
jgi:hypothetical protein